MSETREQPMSFVLLTVASAGTRPLSAWVRIEHVDSVVDLPEGGSKVRMLGGSWADVRETSDEVMALAQQASGFWPQQPEETTP